MAHWNWHHSGNHRMRATALRDQREREREKEREKNQIKTDNSKIVWPHTWTSARASVRKKPLRRSDRAVPLAFCITFNYSFTWMGMEKTERKNQAKPRVIGAIAYVSFIRMLLGSDLNGPKNNVLCKNWRSKNINNNKQNANKSNTTQQTHCRILAERSYNACCLHISCFDCVFLFFLFFLNLLFFHRKIIPCRPVAFVVNQRHWTWKKKQIDNNRNKKINRNKSRTKYQNHIIMYIISCFYFGFGSDLRSYFRYIKSEPVYVCVEGRKRQKKHRQKPNEWKEKKKHKRFSSKWQKNIAYLANCYTMSHCLMYDQYVWQATYASVHVLSIFAQHHKIIYYNNAMCISMCVCVASLSFMNAESVNASHRHAVCAVRIYSTN